MRTNKLILIIVMFLLVSLIAFATVPTHSNPLLNEVTGAETNLTGTNQSGADTESDQIIFNYKWYHKDILNSTRFNDNFSAGGNGSLLLYLPFDENSTKDFSGNRNNGTAYGGVTAVSSGRVYEGFTYDGTDDYIQFMADGRGTFDVQEFTIEAWVYRNTAGADATGIWSYDYTSHVSPYYAQQFRVDQDGLHYSSNIAGTYFSIDTTSPLIVNKWYHVAATHISGKQSLYLNGIEVGSGTQSGSITYYAQEVWAGRTNWLASTFGIVDELKFYSRALSADEINQSYRGARDGFAKINSTIYTGTKGDYRIEMTPYDTTGKGIPKNNTLTTPDTTFPIVNVTINNTSPRRYDLINISANITDETGLLSANITINFSIGKMFKNYTISGTSTSIYNITNITDSRGNLLNITVYATDTNNNVKQNSTLITIANTIPNATNFVNSTGINYNKNVTINWTASTDNEEILRYVVFWDLDINPTALYYNGTGLNITTNFTSDNTYFFQIKVMDEISESALSPVFNITLDTNTPVLTYNISNNLFTNKNQTLLIVMEDVNPFNLTSRFYGTSTINEKSNQTPFGRFINLTLKINVTEDGNYTIAINGSDKHTKRGFPDLIPTYANSTLSFTSISIPGIKIDLEFGYKVGTGDVQKITSTQITAYNIQKIITNSTDRINFGLEADTPPTGQNIKFGFRIIDNQNTRLVDLTENALFHLYSRYWIDFKTYIVNVQTGTKTLLQESYLYQNGYHIIYYDINFANYGLSVGNRFQIITESIGGLNLVNEIRNIIYDFTPPSIISFNLTNNTFTNDNGFNFTSNATDLYTEKILLFVNDLGNTTIPFSNSIMANITLNASDGNYTLKLQFNDTAGNIVNSTTRNLVIDTKAPTFISASNRTADSSNSTNILTTTNVNISIFGLDDLYLDRGNFSHNASGLWVNYSISIIGNTTPYYHIIGSGNFTANQVVGWKFYVYDIAGNELDPVYTFAINAPPTTSTTTSSSGSGGGAGGGGIGATRQCREYSIIYKTCFYFDGISQCLKGCQKGQSCNSTYECVGTVEAEVIPSSQSLLSPITSPLQRFLSWVKQLLGLSSKNPELSIFGGLNTISEGTSNPPESLTFKEVKEKTTQAFKQNKWLPYIIVAAVIAGFGIYIYGLWQTPLALIMGFGIYGYIIIFILLIILYMFFKYF